MMSEFGTAVGYCYVGLKMRTDLARVHRSIHDGRPDEDGRAIEVVSNRWPAWLVEGRRFRWSVALDILMGDATTVRAVKEAEPLMSGRVNTFAAVVGDIALSRVWYSPGTLIAKTRRKLLSALPPEEPLSIDAVTTDRPDSRHRCRVTVGRNIKGRRQRARIPHNAYSKWSPRYANAFPTRHNLWPSVSDSSSENRECWSTRQTTLPPHQIPWPGICASSLLPGLGGNQLSTQISGSLKLFMIGTMVESGRRFWQWVFTRFNPKFSITARFSEGDPIHEWIVLFLTDRKVWHRSRDYFVRYKALHVSGASLSVLRRSNRQRTRRRPISKKASTLILVFTDCALRQYVYPKTDALRDFILRPRNTTSKPASKKSLFAPWAAMAGVAWTSGIEYKAKHTARSNPSSSQMAYLRP
ncbi:P-loop containing nucleoside triphosphate hydrolase protein [Salix suchowensis]|nr:P-loop containing nucleoside triphosphate hydrolase protein [Salix suchowensis]